MTDAQVVKDVKDVVVKTGIPRSLAFPAATGAVGLLVGAGLTAGVSHFLRKRREKKWVEEKMNEQFVINPDQLSLGFLDTLTEVVQDAKAATADMHNVIDRFQAAGNRYLKEQVDLLGYAPAAEDPLEKPVPVSGPGLPPGAQVRRAENGEREITISKSGQLPPDDDPTDTHVTVNLVEDQDWDYAVENRKRDASKPYIIHHDEFHEENPDTEDFRQSTLEYWEGDGVLIDEHDEVVVNAPAVVGDLKFGHGSKDPDVCYVRNVKQKREYEIVRNEGFYGVEILGQEMEASAELQHSRYSVPKFREE